jgi:1,4-dihydroxy-2-naphthoate octaprenyltransferase
MKFILLGACVLSLVAGVLIVAANTDPALNLLGSICIVFGVIGLTSPIGRKP